MIQRVLRDLRKLGAIRLRGWPVLLALVAVAAVTLATFQGLSWRDADAQRDDRADAIAIAKQQVIDLTTLTADTVDDQLKAMQKRVTGSFAGELERFTSVFTQSVKSSKVVATGKVEAAGVSSLENDSASVVVASSAEIRTEKQKRATVRTYRIKVDLERRSGDWLISGMEFVP